jgi:hypothetical protein
MKRTYLVALLVYLALATCAPAQTYLSGPLSGTLESDEYLVDGPISIESGETLTIESGSHLKFMGYFSFQINGILIAEGFEGDSIIFDCDPNTVPDGWHGLRFEGTEPSASSLAYCRISYGEGQGSAFEEQGGGIYCHYAAPTFSHCIISNNSAPLYGGGIYLYLSSATFIHCSISDNSTSYLGGGICAFDSDFTLDFSLVANNTAESGGGLNASNSEFFLANSVIQNNYCTVDGGGIKIAGFPSATIENCLIYGNSADGT